MASEGKYMAYVGSYSYNGKAKGEIRGDCKIPLFLWEE